MWFISKKNFVVLIYLFSLLKVIDLSAQTEVPDKFRYNWYFGYYCSITFNTPDVKPVSINDNNKIVQSEGVACISDKTGNLLFYTNGTTVWNKHHVIMDQGSGLRGSDQAAQSVVIVKQPGNNNKYYLFTNENWSNQPASTDKGFNYNIIDMDLNGGDGKVIFKSPTALVTESFEYVTGTFHSNKKDIWIVTHRSKKGTYNPVTDANGGYNEYLAFLLTETGLNTTPVPSPIGSVHSSFDATDDYGPNRFGSLRFSSDGKRLALTLGGYSTFADTKRTELFDFNNTTVKVYHQITIPNLSERMYYSEFSPDGTKLYTCQDGSGIYCFEIGTETAVNTGYISTYTSDGVLHGLGVSCLQLGPDGKIYAAGSGNTYLGVINNPNEPFASLQYNGQGVKLDETLNVLPDGTESARSSAYCLPNFICVNQNPIVIDISVVPNTNCVGKPTSFVETVTPSDAALLWTFGDPTSGATNTSTAHHPTHTYSANGEYQVILTATTLSGSFTKSDTFQVTITTCKPPFDCAECVPSFSPIPNEKYLVGGWMKEDFTDKYPDTYIHGGIQLTFLDAAHNPIGGAHLFRPSGPIIDGW